jgi:hypothetical protein
MKRYLENRPKKQQNTLTKMLTHGAKDPMVIILKKQSDSNIPHFLKEAGFQPKYTQYEFSQPPATFPALLFI